MSLGTTAYRAAVHLYPPGFRREFGGEMLRDFLEATDEAARGGERRVLRLWVHLGADFVRSLVRQWIRTGLPLVALIAVVCPAAGIGLTTTFLSSRNWGASMPVAKDAEVLAFFLLIVVVLLVIVATICITHWLTRTVLSRHRR